MLHISTHFQGSSTVAWDVTFDRCILEATEGQGPTEKVSAVRSAFGMQRPKGNPRVSLVLPRFSHVFTLSQLLLLLVTWL